MRGRPTRESRAGTPGHHRNIMISAAPENCGSLFLRVGQRHSRWHMPISREAITFIGLASLKAREQGI